MSSNDEYDVSEEPQMTSSLGRMTTSDVSGYGSTTFVPIAISLAAALLGGMSLFMQVTSTGERENTQTSQVELENSVERLLMSGDDVLKRLEAIETAQANLETRQQSLSQTTQQVVDRLSVEIRNTRNSIQETNTALERLRAGLDETRTRMIETPKVAVTVPDFAPAPAPVVTPSQVIAPATVQPSTASQPRIHEVASGDNFTRIAQQYGVKVADIEAANPGVDSSRLKVGQKIKIPAKP